MQITIYKQWQCATARDRFGGGDEGMRNRHHDIARADARSHQGEAERIRAAVDGDRMLRVAEGGECLLEVFDHRATDKAGGADGLLEDRGQLGFEFNMRSNKIKKRNAGHAHFVTSEA